MLGRLLKSNPSRLDPSRTSTSFACLARCGSATCCQAGDESAERELISVRTEAAENRLGAGRQRGMSTLCFAGEDVRQVDLDVGTGYRGEGITHGETGVRICAGVDNDSIGISPQALYRIDEGALMVRLGERDLDTKLTRDRAQSRLDISERCGSVDLGLSRPEQVEVGSVEYSQLNFLRSPSIHAVNWRMSVPLGSSAPASEPDSVVEPWPEFGAE